MFKVNKGWCVYDGEIFKYFRKMTDAVRYYNVKANIVVELIVK